MELQRAQYEDIMRVYERRRLGNHDTEVKRQAEVCAKIPGFRELNGSVAALSLKYAKKLLAGDESARAALKSEIESVSEKRAKLLIKAGFPPDYLDPVYTCRDCKDTGYTGGQKCHCLKQEIIAQLYKQSNIRELLEEENFGKFQIGLYSEGFIDERTGRSSREVIEDALISVHHIVDTFGTEFNNLFLYGSVGVGKTFLANCAAKEIIDKGFSVLYFSAANFFNAMADGIFMRNNPETRYVYEQMFGCDLLVIDDLGTEYDNSFVSSELFYVINERILNKKSTVISTNLTLEELKERYTERCFSRITSNYTMVKLIGDDLRLKKKLQGI